MNHTIAVVGTAFDSRHKEKIRTVAERTGCSVRFFQNYDEALPALPDVNILFAPSDARSPEIVKNAPNLKWFASYFAGVDPLLKSGVIGKNVILTNGSGAYGVTIAEHMIMVTLMLLRRYPEYREFVETKQFRSDLMIGSLYGATVVIVGTGDIGSKFAQRLRAFCPAKIIGVNRSGRRVDFFDEVYSIGDIDSVLPQADVLALTLPATPETDNLITRDRLAMMQETAFLVNVGRGNCLDQDALIDVLNSGKLAGAALDVFKTEPVPENAPAWNTKNLLFTPHCSGKMTMAYTRDTLVDTFCENLSRFHSGQPMLHVVNPELGY